MFIPLYEKKRTLLGTNILSGSESLALLFVLQLIRTKLAVGASQAHLALPCNLTANLQQHSKTWISFHNLRFLFIRPSALHKLIHQHEG